MNAIPKQTWADGVRAVHEEAAGVLTMQVIRQSDAVDLLTEALQGSADAARLLTLIAQTTERIDAARHTRCVSAWNRDPVGG